jgi:uncharacterized protein (TIGR02996 family)
MTDDRAAFLAAIRANPEDDACRLVFADWLQEHGEEARSEFVRAQVSAARLDDLDPVRVRLDRRAAELLATNETKWFAPFKAGGKSVVTERGFLTGVEIGAKRLREKAQDFFAREPLWSVHPVSLQPDRENLDKMMAVLASTRELAFTGLSGSLKSVPIAGWSKILDSPTLGSVHSLRLVGNDMPLASQARLFVTPHPCNVRRLVLNQELRGAARTLAGPTEPPLLASVRELDGLSRSFLTACAHQPFLSRIERLGLYLDQNTRGQGPTFPTARLRSLRVGGDSGGNDLGSFLGAGWPALERLDVDATLPTAVLHHLADNRTFPRLRRLRFRTQLPAHLNQAKKKTTEELRAWAGSPVAGQLEELTIDWRADSFPGKTNGKDVMSPFPGDFLRALAERPTPTRLRKITLDHAFLSAETMDRLGRSANFPDLRGMWLRLCSFPKNSLVPLAKIALPNLRSVGLTGVAARFDLSVLVNRFGQDGVRTQDPRSGDDLGSDS